MNQQRHFALQTILAVEEKKRAERKPDGANLGHVKLIALP